MTLWITVDKVAKFLNVSPRRIRALLSQRRIHGYKDERNIWLVEWPLHVLPGKRGPDLKHFPVRQVYTEPTSLRESAKRRTSGIVTSINRKET